jgi:hypothetical protein
LLHFAKNRSVLQRFESHQEGEVRMGNCRSLAAVAYDLAVTWKEEEERLFRELKIPEARLGPLKDARFDAMSQLTLLMWRVGVVQNALRVVVDNRNIETKCLRARMNPADFDPPMDAA